MDGMIKMVCVLCGESVLVDRRDLNKQRPCLKNRDLRPRVLETPWEWASSKGACADSKAVEGS